MSEENKHVLLRTDLERGFDEAGVLAEIDAMAEGGGAWHDHIPYLAARHFYEGPDVSPQYVKHVDECGTCQRLIDALNPTRKVLEKLQGLRRKGERERETVKGSGKEDEMGRDSPLASGPGGVMPRWLSGWQPAHAAVALLAGAGVTWAVMNFGGSQLPAEAQLIAKSPSAIPREHEFADAFMRAPGLFETDQRRVGFVRVADGYALVKVDDNRVALLAAEASMDASLGTLEAELSELAGKESLTEGDRLRMVELMIRAGRTDEATASLGEALERSGSGGWAEALEGAELIGAVFGHAGVEEAGGTVGPPG